MVDRSNRYAKSQKKAALSKGEQPGTDGAKGEAEKTAGSGMPHEPDPGPVGKMGEDKGPDESGMGGMVSRHKQEHGEMVKRHAEEHTSMVERHGKEMKAMHDRHHKELVSPPEGSGPEEGRKGAEHIDGEKGVEA